MKNRIENSLSASRWERFFITVEQGNGSKADSFIAFIHISFFLFITIYGLQADADKIYYIRARQDFKAAERTENWFLLDAS